MLTNDLVIRDPPNSLVHKAPNRNTVVEGGLASTPEGFRQHLSTIKPIHVKPRSRGVKGDLCQGLRQPRLSFAETGNNLESDRLCLGNRYGVKAVCYRCVNMVYVYLHIYNEKDSVRKSKLYCKGESSESESTICGGVTLVELSVRVFTDDCSWCLRRDSPLD